MAIPAQPAAVVHHFPRAANAPALLFAQLPPQSGLRLISVGRPINSKLGKMNTYLVAFVFGSSLPPFGSGLSSYTGGAGKLRRPYNEGPNGDIFRGP